MEANREALARLLGKSLAPCTARQYHSSYQIWKEYALLKQIPELPANPEHLACCLAVHGEKTRSLQSCIKLAAAVGDQHSRNFLPSPTTAPGMAKVFRY